jgi:hypothetical protein
MAILSPSLEIIKRQKVLPTEGEWTLLNFLLDNLDDTFEIYFQPYLNGDNPDIAIMRKGSGVLLIEVKDWDLTHYSIDEKTKWKLRKDNTPIKSPLEQVENYKSNLFNLHLENLHNKSIENKNHWATVNCAVYFHKSTESNLKSFLLDKFKSPQNDSYLKFVSYFGLLGNDSLTVDKLNSHLTRFWLNKTSYYFDETLYKSFQRYLKPPIHQKEEGININYSKEQQELIRSEIRPRRKIKGVAGSGKTLVLAKRAVNAHIRTNERILILTYNLSLKNYIHDRISDVREDFHWDNFYITNYHQFFKTQANNYNLDILSLGAWQNTSFFESVKDNIKKFDVVLIDEIQDYMQSWIDIITSYFTHNETEFVVFGDEKQNIYNRELDENNEPIVRTIPSVWNKSLNVSHRFASNIGNIAIKFQKTVFGLKYGADELKVMSQFDFETRIIEYHFFSTYTTDELYRTVYSVLERNQIHSSDAGILGSKVEILRDLDFTIRTKRHENTSVTFESEEEYQKFKNNKNKIEELRRFKKNHFYMKTGTVKLSTIHSFKGWEIDTLFLFIEKEDDNTDESPEDFTTAELIYTGLTRARKNLIIFNLGNYKYNEFFKSEIQTQFYHNPIN